MKKTPANEKRVWTEQEKNDLLENARQIKECMKAILDIGDADGDIVNDIGIYAFPFSESLDSQWLTVSGWCDHIEQDIEALTKYGANS